VFPTFLKKRYDGTNRWLRGEVVLSSRFVLVAGLSCSGKSTLIQLLRKGGLDQVVLTLGLDGAAGAVTRTAYQMHDRRPLQAGILNLIHYDLLRPIREPDIADYSMDPVFPLLADSVPDMVIHMDPDPNILQAMLSARIRQRWYSVRHVLRPFDEGRRLQFLRELRSRYADRNWMQDRLGRWRMFALSHFTCPHVVVHHHGFHRPDWRDYVRVQHVTQPLEALFRSCGSLSG